MKDFPALIKRILALEFVTFSHWSRDFMALWLCRFLSNNIFLILKQNAKLKEIRPGKGHGIHGGFGGKAGGGGGKASATAARPRATFASISLHDSVGQGQPQQTKAHTLYLSHFSCYQITNPMSQIDPTKLRMMPSL